jgi:signal transduction histidine kinase
MTFKCEPLELETLVLQVVEDSKVLAEQEDVRIACLVTTCGASVNGDADRLMQALSNLLTNAIKYSPPGDSIEVVVGTHYSMHRIDVTDHGPGISEEFRNQIFKRFTQARGGRKGWKAGTGLGLSITKLIVQHHGGHIDYRSTPGVSTTFSLDLPRAEEQCSTTAASSWN